MSQADSHDTTSKPISDYTFDDVTSDLQHMVELVDTVVSSLVSVDQRKLDCADRNELNRAASLAWITRDQLEIIKDRVCQKNDADAAASS